MFIYQGSIISNFLSQNAQQYKIPVYQRNYEWSWEQCDKLFDDVVTAAKRNQLHFCGSIVFQPIAPVKGINNNIIIDGQQRLTTIYILMKALVDMAENEAERLLPQQALFNTDQFGQYQLDETTKMKLKPAKDNNDQLIALLYGKQIDKSCEIYRNYSHFCDLINKEKANGITVADIYRGLGLLTVAVIQLDANDKAQEIFERINSTGVPLSLADMIRNYVLMTDVDQDRLYEEYWLKIEQMLAREQLSDFFMDYLNFKSEGWVKENEAYEEFKNIYLHDGYTNESMLQEIYHYANLYKIFLAGNDELGAKINDSLDGLRRLGQTTVFLFLFKIFDDFENGIIDKNELAKILNLLLSYSIRRLICEIGSNSLRGFYKTLYNRVFNIEEHKEHYYDSIVSFMLQINSKDAIPDNESFKQALKEKNLYRKNALCKYLLVAIENQGKEKVITDGLSIEHIMPQNKNVSTEWQNMLGEDWEAVKEKYLHTLGNLTLTGYNSELGDKPFDEKKELLSDTITHIVELYKDVKDKDIWNAAAMESRADRLSDVIIELFPIVGPDTVIEFNDPRYRLYTAADPQNATYKSVNYFELLGERITTDSFANMRKTVIRRLYEYDKSVIERLARNEENLPYWNTPTFSYNKENIRHAERLNDDSDIYMSSNFSARDCMWSIKGLLMVYNLNLDEDFCYNARSTISDAKVDYLATMKKWCEQKKEEGLLNYNAANCESRFVRFTTDTLNQYIPNHTEKLSPWETKNFYFYEITNYKSEMYIQLYFYCKGITDEMEKAFLHLSDITGKGNLTKGYKLYFLSSKIGNDEEDTEEIILKQLDGLFEEVMQFESNVKANWN